jgi:hypothetical protein
MPSHTRGRGLSRYTQFAFRQIARFTPSARRYAPREHLRINIRGAADLIYIYSLVLVGLTKKNKIPLYKSRESVQN